MKLLEARVRILRQSFDAGSKRFRCVATASHFDRPLWLVAAMEFDGHRFRGSEVVQPIVAFIRRHDGLDDVIIRSRDS